MKIEEYVERAESLFVLPDSVTMLKASMDDATTNMEDIGKVISTDPALTAQLLKVANSALYRFPNKIETISRALQVIGVRAAYDMSLAYGVSHAFRKVSSAFFDTDKYWEQSVSCALIAKHIGEHHNLRNVERLFVAGLLHNVGELVVLSLNPEAAQKCLEFNRNVEPDALQKGLLGFEYTQLSASLIQQWGLPDTIWKPIELIHAPLTASSDVDARIMQMAYCLALDNVNSEVYPAYTHVNNSMQDALGLEHEDLEDTLDITNMQCLSILSLFNPSSFMVY